MLPATAQAALTSGQAHSAQVRERCTTTFSHQPDRSALNPARWAFCAGR